MSTIGSYKNAAFSESQKFLVLDPETGSTSLVRGSSLIAYITPRLNSVIAESTRLAAENTDYDIGTLIQTSGSGSPGDNFAATYLVVGGGEGDFPMVNGNELLVIRGDEFLREQLIQNTVGDGSDLVAHTGTADTVTEALNKRTIYVGSVAELEALSLPVGTNVYLVDGGRSGAGVIKSGSHASDPQKGIFIDLANGNYWERIQKDPVNVKWFGAVGDGTTPSTVAFKAAVLYCVEQQKQLYCPAGTYILRPSTDNGPIYLNKGITADGMGFSMFGDGRGKTIIKEGDGETELGGRFTTMFYCWLADPDTRDSRYGSFTFRDMTFDKNGRSNGVPPSTFEWEGAHIIKFQGVDPVTDQIDAITFERIELKDKIGAGIVAGPASTVCRSLSISDLQSQDHPSIVENGGNFGQKGCIEVAIDSDLTTFDSVNCIYSQVEPTFDYVEGKESIFKLSNCVISTFQYTYSSAKVSAAGGKSGIYIDAVNIETSDQFLVRGVHLQAANCTIVADTEWYPVSAKVSSSKILLPYDAATSSVTSFYLRTPLDWRPEANFDNCEFLIDADTVDAAATGYCVRANNQTEALSAKATFNNCAFDPRALGVYDAYSNGGNFKFINCELGANSSGEAFQSGAFSDRYSNTEIINCDFSRVQGSYVSILENSSTYNLKLTGDYRSDDFEYSSNNISNVTTGQYAFKPTLWGTAAPTSGPWPKGQKVYNQEPSAGGVEGWVCVTAGSPGTWKAFGSVEA